MHAVYARRTEDAAAVTECEPPSRRRLHYLSLLVILFARLSLLPYSFLSHFFGVIMLMILLHFSGDGSSKQVLNDVSPMAY